MLEKLLSNILSWLWNAARSRFRLRQAGQGETHLTSPAIPEGDILIGHEIAPDGAIKKGPAGVVVLRDADLRRAVHIMGRPGAGKSVLLMVILSTLLSSIHRTGQGSLLLLDYLGDRVDDVIALIASLFGSEGAARSVVLIDGRQDAWVPPLNPLAGRGDPHSRALFTLGFVKRFAEGWGVTIEWCLSACLLACARTGLSLADVIPLLEDEGFAKAVLSQIRDAQCHRFFRHFWTLGERERGPFISSVENKFAPLMADRRLWLALSQRENLDLGALLDKPGTILLVALGDRPQTATLLGSLIMASLHNAIMARASLPEQARVPTTLLLDEFAALAKYEEFETLSSQCRRLNARLILANQSLQQLDERLRSAIRNHSGASIFLSTGFQDANVLAREVNSDLPQEIVRGQLINSPPGAGFFVRPSEKSVRFQALNYVPPDVGEADVIGVRSAALRAFSRPATEAEEELHSRVSPHSPLQNGSEVASPELRSSSGSDQDDENGNGGRRPARLLEVQEIDDRQPQRKRRPRRGPTPKSPDTTAHVPDSPDAKGSEAVE